ncbi:hypothetical protein HU200_010227 [Digitaria exilis]|uniref:FBD domain-containing protein n=1 Tax=Digitaria exilis TaxID=1010633 RepID=A0A835KM61_9POAL|nr:hypothetical protein HU200_010227 [Digitaria exilis]
MARPNQRCCRRCHRNLPDCSCGAGARHSRRSARFRRDPEPEGDGADHISALHDDLLLHILARLGCTHAAARTGLLSRRWRGLWNRLPELVLREVEPGSLDAVLADVVARFRPQSRPQPPLSLLDVRSPHDHIFSSVAQITSLFDAAAALQPESLVVSVTAARPGVVTLPRLDHTKSITQDVCRVHLVPPQDQDGGMPALESLSLRRYDGIETLRLDRFSALRSLSVSDWRRDSILICQPFLEELVLMASVQLRRVWIAAPSLKKLTFHARAGVADDFSLHYVAPKVEDLLWQCTNYASHARFGDIWTPRMVTINTSEPQVHLQHTPGSNMYTLSLGIWEGQVFVLEGAESFEHYISSLFPVANFSVLELCIQSCGHVYGAMVLHLLGVYTLIKRLKVDLRKLEVIGLFFFMLYILHYRNNGEDYAALIAPRIQLNDWRNQAISLTDLKEMEINGVRGEDHEIDMFKVILRSAALLQKVAFTFSLKSEQRIRSFSSKIRSILKAHPSVECKIYRCSGELVLSA